MLYCPNCQCESEEGSVFCWSCGQKLTKGEVKADNTELMLQAAYYYREGEIADADVDRAVKIYKKLLEKDNNNVRALHGMHWCFHNTSNHQENFKYWFPLVKKAADLGHAPSQVVLGDYYSDIAGDPSSFASYNEAFFWYKMAAAQDNIYALSGLAWKTVFCEDAGTEEQKNAIAYLEKAYSLEPKTFAHELGKAYYLIKSDAVRDYKKAMYYCKIGAFNGDWQSAYIVGKMYELGQGVEADIYNALSWYNLAASHGDEDAVRRLAIVADDKEKYNLTINADENIKYLEDASEVSSVFCISLMKAYMKGTLGTIDQDTADYYEKKFGEIRDRKNESTLGPEIAEEIHGNCFELRSIAYAKAVTLWDVTPDGDVFEKKNIIKMFEQNIEEHSDLWSLRTLVALLMGDYDIHREDNIEKPVICSIPQVIDVKRAFELLEKGIAWGDEKCEQLLKDYISRVEV